VRPADLTNWSQIQGIVCSLQRFFEKELEDRPEAQRFNMAFCRMDLAVGVFVDNTEGIDEVA
jgi:hypothetical protein